MNHDTQWAPGQHYNIYTGNVKTVEGSNPLIIEFEDEVRLSELPDAPTNTDVVTVDAFNNLGKTNASALPGGNPFDQDLNTTDDVQFNEVSVSDASPPLTIGYDTFKFIKPELFTSGNWGARQSFYLDNVGILESTLPHFGLALSARNDQNISFSQYFTQESPFGWKYSETNQDTMRIHYQDYVSPGVSRGLNFYVNDSQGNAGDVVSEQIAMSLQSNLYGLGLHIAPINNNSSLYIDNITTDNTNTRILTMDNNGRVQESTHFEKLGIGIDPNAAQIDGNLGIFKLSNVSSPAPNWGTRTHYYLDGTPYPLMTINVSRTTDQNFTFGSYWNGQTTTWNSSDNLSSFKIQRNFDRFNFIVTKGPQIAGTPTIERIPVYIKADTDLGLYIDNGALGEGGLYMKSMDSVVDGSLILAIDPVNGKALKSAVLINSSNNMTIPGSLDIQTVSSLPSEIDMRFVAGFVSGDDTLQKQDKQFLFQQNLEPSSNVEFNRLTADDFIQTDTIIENTVNNGVSVSSWSLKPQSIVSDSLVTQNDPLRIDLNLFGDTDTVLSMNGYNHDNNGIMFDMKKEETGTIDDMVSSSVNANIFINKQLGALKFLVTNGITKGFTFLKSTMNNVMEIGKTYVNINEPCTFSEAVLITTTSTTATNYDNLVIDSTSGELKKQEQGYTSLYINILQTLTINTLNVYEQITGYNAGGVSKNMDPDSVAGNFEAEIDGRLRITISGSFQGNASPTKVYELSLFKNGGTVPQAQTIFSTSTSLDDYYSAYCETVDDCVIGDVYDVRIRNTTDTTNISIRTVYFTVQSIII